MKQQMARLKWSERENRWNLSLWIDGKWEFSQAWYPKDQNPVGVGWVHESILMKLENLQYLGYEVFIVL